MTASTQRSGPHDQPGHIAMRAASIGLDPRERLGLMHIPPPALALASVVAQRVVARTLPITPVRGVLATAIAAGSAAFPMTALKQLQRAGTTVDPTHPERTTALVST